jgi:DNA-binding transcriptional LysR family regulator
MGVPLEPEDLARHHYLRDSGQAVRAHAGRRLRLQPLDGDSPAREVDVPVVLQSVSTELLLRAALDGVGVTVVAQLLAAPFLASGALIHVLPRWIYSRYTVYAALPSRRMLPARTKVFLDFVSEQVPQAVEAQQGG